MSILPFIHLPSEIKFDILDLLDVDSLKKMRTVSREMKSLVDFEMERKMKIRLNSDNHEALMVMVRRFLREGFCPPAVWRMFIVQKPDFVGLTQSLEIEYFFEEFYNSSMMYLGVHAFKNLFTLTFVDILKLIDPAFKVSEIPSKQLTIGTFKIGGLRLSRDWSNQYSVDEFHFKNDYANILIVLFRILVFTNVTNPANAETFLRNLGAPLQLLYRYISHPLDFGNKLMSLKLEKRFQMQIEVRMRGSQTLRKAIMLGEETIPAMGDVFAVSMVWHTLRNGKSN